MLFSSIRRASLGVLAFIAATEHGLVSAVRKHASTQELRARHLQHAQSALANQPQARAISSGGPGTVKNITFTNPRASEFYVDGATIPQVDWDVGPSWAGLLPISGAANETRELFFWFFPPGPEGSLDDLIFWTNGGPGCSSMDGLLQENGPISWLLGQAKATPNQYSWTNLSSILYVDQPVGTGYSQGVPDVSNEDEVAEQLVGFFQQFLEVFSELKGKNFYLSGESYAGMYVPYTANYIYEHPGALDLSLKGFWISDPVLSSNAIQSEIPAVDFVHKYENVFALNQSFLAEIDAIAEQCNYTGYYNTYATYPPAPAPFPYYDSWDTDACDVWDAIFDAALVVNPGFDVYHIFSTWPLLWDVLGFPTQVFQTQVAPLYFNRTDVKEALHAPLDVDWQICSNENVFVGDGDTSLPPVFTVLPSIIEKSERSVIVNGLADFLLIAEGARIAIQNMTWGGQQGFQTPILNDSFVVDGFGALGTTHTERGLTFYEVELSGHMVPQYAPWSAFQIMQYLMGFRDTP